MPRTYSEMAAVAATRVLITGNVMVHAEALTGRGGVVLDENATLRPFMEWAGAGRSGGGAVWTQINHPAGRWPPACPAWCGGPPTSASTSAGTAVASAVRPP
ncbi:beta/alpha barrel domain-containing protein [Streptomyces anulatus]|uniref:hypothetical protein n=1 Tax=Streptomyces anulatus TaxID=1892 RepID=UPI0036BAABA1